MVGGGGRAGARQRAAQLDSFANSERRGEKGGCGILGPARPGAATGDSEPRPPVAPRLPQPSAHPALLRPRRQRGPTRSPTFPHFPAPPSPSAPPAPSPSSPNPATSAAAATHAARRGERPAGLRAHTHTSSSLRAPCPARRPLRRPRSRRRVRLRSAPTPRAAEKLSYGPPPRHTHKALGRRRCLCEPAGRPGARPGSVSPAPGARSPILRPLARTPQTLTGDELPLGQVLRVALFAAGHCPGIYSGIARRAALMGGAGGGGPSRRRCRRAAAAAAAAPPLPGLVFWFFFSLPLLPSLPPLLLYFALSSTLFFVLFAKRKRRKRKEKALDLK